MYTHSVSDQDSLNPDPDPDILLNRIRIQAAAESGSNPGTRFRIQSKDLCDKANFFD